MIGKNRSGEHPLTVGEGVIVKYVLALVFFLVATTASAQDDCIGKFSGDWMVRLNTGQTYLGHHLPNGVATADCAMCSPGRWTCQGNTITKSTGWTRYSGTLSADGNTIVEPYGVLTRVGPPPTVNMPTANAPTSPTVRTPTVSTPTSPTVHTPTVGTPTSPTVRTPTVSTPTSPTVHTPTVSTPTSPTVHTPTVSTPTSPTMHTPTASTRNAAETKRCNDARASLTPFAGGMGEQWVKDQLATMQCL